ncbi:MAG: poly-gamma-glutamate synthase PgsB [Candidatus Cloacimonetes bacterium]|nr:poly-gamma-glutamate synthase PgsB [Candidatus Cloacimonadota bacterium]
MIVLTLATIAFILYFIFEYLRHRKNVMSIPIRIHVNGTRGKSSVTRLIAAGLRGGGIATIAKTTGTLPRVVLPDAQESAIIRLMGANIIEQKYIFRFAKSLRPQAIVVECMAVNPIFQWVTERMFVKSTISVITNTRLDHIDLMGSTVDSIAMCLSNTIPENGICFTSEVLRFPILKNIADQRKTKIHKVTPLDVTDTEISKFNYIEHKDNVQLALAVCEHCGVSREDALSAMQKANPDPGALKKYVVNEKDKRLVFYNVFAANDPESTAFLYRLMTENLRPEATKMIMLNSRADRFFRSQQLIDFIPDVAVDYVLLTGEVPEKVFAYAISKNIPKEKLVALGEIDPKLVYEKSLELTKKEAHIFGIGNIAGARKYGAHLVKQFKIKSEEI